MRADFVQGVTADGLIVLDVPALFAHPLFAETQAGAIDRGSTDT
jgi:hypothetical protein